MTASVEDALTPTLRSRPQELGSPRETAVISMTGPLQLFTAQEVILSEVFVVLQCPQRDIGDSTVLGNRTGQEVKPCHVVTHVSPK